LQFWHRLQGLSFKLSPSARQFKIFKNSKAAFFLPRESSPAKSNAWLILLFSIDFLKNSNCFLWPINIFAFLPAKAGLLIKLN